MNDPSSKISLQGSGFTGKAQDAKSNARMQKAAKDFEAIFLGYMLKSMRSSIPKSDMFGESFGGDILDQMFDMELAKQLTKSGHLGIGEMVAKGVASRNSVETGKSAAPVPVQPAAVPVMPKQAAIAPTVTQNAALPLAPEKTATQPPQTNSAPAARPAEKTEPELPPWITSTTSAATKKSTAPAGVPTATPPLQASADTLRRVNGYDAMIREAAGTLGVSPHLVKAVMTAESAGQKRAQSGSDAKGLMQLIDSTASAMGVKDVWNPRDNIMGGVKYLQQQIERFDGNIEKAVAAYNAGPGAVEKHDGVPPYRETRQYVQRVMGYLKYYQAQEADGDDQ